MVYIYFTLYILVINIIGFYIMYLDKKKSIKGSFRISEKTLFMVSLLLGGLGVYIGMYTFRHKTKHLSFTVGIPVCIAINTISIYYIISKNLLNFFIK